MSAVKEQMPHNVEAEQAALGSLLIDPERLWLARDAGLKPGVFYIEKHNMILNAIERLMKQDAHIDLTTVADALDRSGQLDLVGGSAYLSMVMASVPTALHLESYARIVAGTHKRREVIQAASDMARMALSDEPLSDVLGRVESSLFSLNHDNDTRQIALGDSFSSLYDDLSEAQRTSDGSINTAGVEIPYLDLAKILGLWHNSELYLLAARPGVGKTAFLCQIALDTARQGGTVLFFSSEMSHRQITARMVSNETGVNNQSIRNRSLSESEWNAVVASAPVFVEADIVIDDSYRLSPFDVRSRTRKAAAARGRVDLVLIDYIQLMTPDYREETRNLELGLICRGLKALSKEVDAPVISAAQLSRAVERRQDKRPLLSDLRDSGELEQVSDNVLFLYRDEIYNSDTESENVVDVIVAKQRNGPTGTSSLYFDKETGSFKDATTRRIDLGEIKL